MNNPPGNSEDDRIRRRLAATSQALSDARTGVAQFEARTADHQARQLCAVMVRCRIAELSLLVEKLEGTSNDPVPLARGASLVSATSAEVDSASQPGTSARSPSSQTRDPEPQTQAYDQPQ